MNKSIVSIVTAFVIFVFSISAQAQQSGKVYRIGYLHHATLADSRGVAAFRQSLRDLGYVEGRNITIIYRAPATMRDWRARLPENAADLVRRKVDVIFACCPPAVAAARKATRTIPIVFSVMGDAVAEGVATSLRRPGGNLTGLSTFAPDLTGTQLQLLKEAVPGLSRIAVLRLVGNPTHATVMKHAESDAPALGVRLVPLAVNGSADLPDAFRRMKAERVGAVLVLRSGALLRLRSRIAALAREAGLASMFGHRPEAVAGGLMAYGADTVALFRGAAAYVDKILKGADPAELPISQATKFNLVVNMRTARALGITLSPSILLGADEVIE